jgi:hypothetical protein
MSSRASSNPYAVSSSEGLAPAYQAPARPDPAHTTSAPSPAAEAPLSTRTTADETPPTGTTDLDTMTLPPHAAVGWSPTSWRRAMSASSRG